VGDYRSEREYEERLAKIVLHSADTATSLVASYLDELVSRRSWRGKDQPLKEYGSLVKHLPDRFVDYALAALIEDKGQLDWSDLGPDRLGIGGSLDFFPAAPIQGPFLPLLRHHPVQGLRLVHGLTNRATEVWRTSMRTHGRLDSPLTPVPLVLDLPDGEKAFWGDEHVYRWHRGTGVGPPAVASALMALEVWLEEALVAGKSAEGLFAEVLAGTESIAVLGVCASVSLFAPHPCLRAALPLLSQPRVWRMDIARRAHEPSAIAPFSTPRTEVFDRVNVGRSRRAYRRADIRSLIPLYLFGDEDLRVAFEAATDGFRERPAFEFEEEREPARKVDELAESVNHLSAFLDPVCYHEVNEGGTVYWEFVPPEHLREGAMESQAAERRLATWLSLGEWARKSLEAGSAAEGLGPDQAIAAAREIEQEGDFARPVTPDLGLDCMRIEAVAQVAAAALVISSPSLEPELLAWGRDVLLSAASAPRGGWTIPESHHPSDIKVSAGRGLGALVAGGKADPESREALLWLITDPEYQVVEAVFAGLSGAWDVDPVLCWNCLGLALTLSSVPRSGVVPGSGLTLNAAGQDWFREATTRYARNLEQGILPDLPQIYQDGGAAFFVYHIATRALKHIPIDTLLSSESFRPATLALVDGMIDKSLAEVRSAAGDRSRLTDLNFKWMSFVMEWLAKAGEGLGAEECLRLLDRIEPTWPEFPSLTQGLLRGFLKFRIGRIDEPSESSVAGWERICSWILGSPETGALVRRVSYSTDLDDVIALIVFVEFGGYWFNERWGHARRFTGVIDRWVETVGTNHAAYAALVTMLLGTAQQFGNDRVLGWLRNIAERSPGLQELWASHRNGERTAELLDQLAGSRTPGDRSRPQSPDLIWLVDRLAGSGIAHASRLRGELESPET
jgi:hypothetical protein